MKFTDSRGNEQVVVWADHTRDCRKCCEVDVSSPRTFSLCCAQGAPLLMEELAKRQAPIESAKRKENEKWAQERGTFIKSRVKDARAITKYK